MSLSKSLFVVASPALLPYYDLEDSVVVVIDILRASSTITMAMENGAAFVLPVDSIDKCKQGAKKYPSAITAGERDGKIIEGLDFGNSPFEYTRELIAHKILILTTTNGTQLLHQAHRHGALEIIIGSFLNISVIVAYLLECKKHVVLACAGWKSKVNMEDLFFAGAVVDRVQAHFDVSCDTALMAEQLYRHNYSHLRTFLPRFSHYKRLSGFHLEKDIWFCFEQDKSKIVPLFDGEKLIPYHVSLPT